MTEDGWLAATDPLDLINGLRGLRWTRTRDGRRKLRLIGCACCRRVWRLMDERGRGWVEQAEAVADGRPLPAREARPFHLGTTSGQPDRQALGAAYLALDRDTFAASASASRMALYAIGSEEMHHGAAPGSFDAEEREQVRIVRDVVANPFRPVAFDKGWRTPAAIGLARSMYEAREFDRTPILADALEEAGCDRPEMLAHCRGDEPHVRGCWVVDLVLG